MPVRIIGALMLAASGILAGFTGAGKAKQTLAFSRALSSALRDAAARIDMTRVPLPLIAQELSRQESAAAPLFAEACDLMRGGAGFCEAMSDSCALIPDPFLRETVRGLFLSAGKNEADETLRRFDSACRAIDGRTQELAAEYESKAPLMRRLGAAAGICAAILFI